MQRFRSLPIAALVATLTAFSGSAETAGNASSQEMNLRPIASEIAGENAEATQVYVGTVVARTEVGLGFPVSGVVATRSADLGDIVKRGDVLARLDPEALEAGAWGGARRCCCVATAL